MALVSPEELAWALDIPLDLAEHALARVRARQLHEPLPPPLPSSSTLTCFIDNRRVRWANETDAYNDWQYSQIPTGRK